MNWNALGAISELVGSGLLIITLVYLVAQFRQTTRTMRSTTFQAINDGMTEAGQVLATDPELARIVLKADAGLDRLSPEERLRYSCFLMMTLRRLQAAYTQQGFGMVGADFVRAYERSMAASFTVGGREWWGSAKHVFPEWFVERFDDLVVSVSLELDARHLGIFSEDSRAASDLREF